MNEIIKNIEAAQMKAEVPQFYVGDTVKVYGKIKEGNRERIQVFEGIVIEEAGRKRTELPSLFVRIPTVSALRRPGRCIPRTVEKVEVVRHGKVRRAKLNYLRGRVGKSAKVKELSKIMESFRDKYIMYIVPVYVLPERGTG